MSSNNKCPCVKVNAVDFKGYRITVKTEQLTSFIQGLKNVKDVSGNTLLITSGTVQPSEDSQNLNVCSPLSGTVSLILTLSTEYNCYETECAQLQCLVAVSGAFNANFQEVQGVLVTSDLCETVQTIAGVTSQAATVGIRFTAINTLFCESELSAPVKLWFGILGNRSENLKTIINNGMYICTSELN
jgi:hypothetical protein